jgi:3-oxoacyl-[acyl-carrier protein] reductase
MRLKNKVAIVTGSSQGIGKAIVSRLAEEGAKVVIVDMKDGNDIVNKIKADNGKALFVHADISKYEDVQKVVQSTTEHFGEIDILVNNAGISGYVGPVVDTPLEDWKKLLEVNLDSAFLLCKSILPGMIAQSYGRIINITSVAYRKNTPNTASYNVSKAGINALTKTLSKEVGKYGITVNAVAPGLVLTDRIKNVRLPGLSKATGLSVDEVREKMENDTDTKQLATEEDIAEAVLFLALDKSKSITGEIINVSGGF